MKLPPQIKLEIIRAAPEAPAFIRTERNLCKLNFPDGKSATTVLDTVIRKCNDAVVIMAVNSGVKSPTHVWLRSCLRPAAAIREAQESNYGFSGNLWELPAGLVDAGELPQEAAKRECLEELGFDIEVQNFKLVHTVLSMPSLISERLYFYIVDCTDYEQCVPCLDGSALEEGAELLCYNIRHLEQDLDNLPDIKTNLGIRILKDYVKI